MNKVYILGGLRTPIVTKNGKFKHQTANQLGAQVIRALVAKYQVASEIDGVIAGNAVGNGGNIARLMTLEAGLPESTPAITVDVQCASGATAIAMAFSQLAIGNGDVYICGGAESSSTQPLRVYDPKDSRYSMVPGGKGEYYTAQFTPGELAPDAMLQGAERTMLSEGMTKQELDFWVLRSHTMAAEATQQGRLDDIIVPIDDWSKDDGIRYKISQRLLDRLPPLLGRDSLLNAGNSCLINDGAAFLLLVTEKWLAKHPECSPQAEIIGAAAAGSNSIESPRGAMNTADKLLERLGYAYEDMDAIEFNEAFAAIDVLFQRAHPTLINRYNQLGGALAYGHPYGASGAIIMLHLLKALASSHGRLGILSIAGAGGMGQAIAVRMITEKLKC